MYVVFLRICFRPMLTESQLEARRHTIGGSDAPIIAGVSPYKQPYELWAEKRGELPPIDLTGNISVTFGIYSKNRSENSGPTRPGTTFAGTIKLSSTTTTSG